MKNLKDPGSGKRFTMTADFANALASGVEDPFSVIVSGAGQAVSQSGGNLLITTGTTANAETILRSRSPFTPPLNLKYSLTLSQRIANNNFFVELVDVIGDDLAFTINSATSVTVTIPNSPFSAVNVGQSMYLGKLTGTAGTIPGRYAIASVSGNDVTFTVAGYPASGSGTVSLFGWNYLHVLYDGVSATAGKFGTANKGYGLADAAIAIASTATGHVVFSTLEDNQTVIADSTSGSTSVGSPVTTRGASVVSIPSDFPLYIQIRAVNGSVAPASTTTCTIGTVMLEDYNPAAVAITSLRTPQTGQSQLPIQIAGTVFSGSSSMSVQGAYASNASGSPGNPIGIAGLGVSAAPAAVTTGRGVVALATLLGAQVVQPFAIPESTWTYAAAAGGIVNTTGITAKAAAGTGIRNYVTGVTLSNNSATATDFQIRDGASGTVLFRAMLPANAANVCFTFPTPIKGTANTLIEIACGTTSSATFANLTGYVAP